MIRLYFAFIRPLLEYGDVVWDNCSQHEADLLENVQVEAARIITGLRRNSSRQKLYKELGWDTLEIRRRNHKLILFYKILNGLTPYYLFDIVQPHLPRQTPYNLRNESTTFHPPFSRTASFYNSFIPSTIRLWNTLPLYIKESPSLNIFKYRLFKHNSFVVALSHYNFGTRRDNIVHCQLRNEASNLKAHLHSHFLADDTTCPNCNFSCEDNEQFFMDCPLYNVQRLALFNPLHQLINNFADVNIN